MSLYWNQIKQVCNRCWEQDLNLRSPFGRQIYSLVRLAAPPSQQMMQISTSWAEGGARTHDLLFTKQLLYRWVTPAETPQLYQRYYSLWSFLQKNDPGWGVLSDKFFPDESRWVSSSSTHGHSIYTPDISAVPFGSRFKLSVRKATPITLTRGQL